MIRKSVTIILLFFSLGVLGEKLVLKLDIKVDNKGDATITYTQKATAMQWKNLMKIYGNNPALLKREIIESLPAYDLSDFSFQKKEMDREFVFTFKAKGVVKYRGEGIWEFEYDKNATPQKLTENKWFFINSESDGNTIYEYNISLTLPEKAKNTQLAQNEFGKSVLRYTLKPEKQISWWTISGILLIIAGFITIIVTFTLIKE